MSAWKNHKEKKCGFLIKNCRYCDEPKPAEPVYVVRNEGINRQQQGRLRALYRQGKLKKKAQLPS